ncbi:hypothetical protein BNJ_00244 [Kaumoebavirus]|uniref:hypothetical protein n=1 Tax=Kaumoebavirus TaxID=1859492 RepID=UPI0009C2D092|nr:hypothetical protein BNJ_00244 [Kaumoebavirus]ARA72072.1 hypothetical protein BNJ_00244 [Kaumoebavirus]
MNPPTLDENLVALKEILIKMKSKGPDFLSLAHKFLTVMENYEKANFMEKRNHFHSIFIETLEIEVMLMATFSLNGEKLGETYDRIRLLISNIHYFLYYNQIEETRDYYNITNDLRRCYEMFEKLFRMKRFMMPERSLEWCDMWNFVNEDRNRAITRYRSKVTFSLT